MSIIPYPKDYKKGDLMPPIVVNIDTPINEINESKLEKVLKKAFADKEVKIKTPLKQRKSRKKRKIM